MQKQITVKYWNSVQFTHAIFLRGILSVTKIAANDNDQKAQVWTDLKKQNLQAAVTSFEVELYGV